MRLFFRLYILCISHILTKYLYILIYNTYCKIYITFHDLTLLVHEEIPLSRNNLIASAKIIHKEYSVSFELMAIAFNPGSFSTSVIHFTTGKDFVNYGDRNPAVFVTNNNLLFYSALNGHITPQKMQPNFNLTLNQWTAIEISQKFISQATYQFDLFVNGINVQTVKNSDARDFSNILVYAGNPWYPVHSGIIRNLNVIGSDIGSSII